MRMGTQQQQYGLNKDLEKVVPKGSSNRYAQLHRLGSSEYYLLRIFPLLGLFWTCLHNGNF